jgi:hypothetical protein
MVNELAERLSPMGVGGGVDVPPLPPQPGRNETELMIKARRKAWKRLDMAGPYVNAERRVTSQCSTEIISEIIRRKRKGRACPE